ncbi:DUF1853 family protein [Endozoicomonas sp. SCSIO W0465]|uniref:DUF1853 family protein n=1 Tax=Endozoicomonas sp. SCSIO W0465 TaxID=2918516 RepID=UPI002075B85C|nr:DUF1853 family protein [Endozoicomonas sp. SCSIO W0465]USE38854.1 DUF1853 family protein [Endozoicomonas sp. SCSIO W0465]
MIKSQPLPAGIAPVIPDQQQLALLASLVNQKSNPLLGIFYETLWQFLLSQLPEGQIVAANLQVKGEKNGQPATIGEYDLIYRLKNQFIHRELAIKFYLGISGKNNSNQGSPWRHWVGPGLKDRLDRKMDRLLHHQALLSDTDEGQAALLTLGIEQPVQKEILIQGRFFYPLYPMNCAGSRTVPLTEIIESGIGSTVEHPASRLCQPPERCNPDHLKGYWLTQNQFLLSTRFTDDISYQVPQKVQWLNQSPITELLDHDALMRQLQQQRRPVYIRAVHQALQAPLHLFIVPDDWPEKAVTVSEKNGSF